MGTFEVCVYSIGALMVIGTLLVVAKHAWEISDTCSILRAGKKERLKQARVDQLERDLRCIDRWTAIQLVEKAVGGDVFDLVTSQNLDEMLTRLKSKEVKS